jgi:hypothetical protein
MLRVGRNVFFTTPNKYFPVELHTRVFFIHWWDALFQKWRRKNAGRITTILIHLLSYRGLKKLLIASNADTYTIYKNRFLGIPLTYTVICTT